MSILNEINYAMSLREPQAEALSYLDKISRNCDYKVNTKEAIEQVATENCENNKKIKVADEFTFPSFCFNMTTGIGKTRLMGASIYYLYKTKGYKHFFILAPGNTIYEKLKRESNPNHPKYIFKGLESEMGRPKVYDGDNYVKYPVRYVQGQFEFEKTSEIEIFIFNIGKIFNRGDVKFNFYKYQETLGMSFADVLANFDDLVICMDEAHRYYAPASMRAISYLKPILGLEFTATPKSTNRNIIYSYGLEKGAGKYLKIPVVMGRTNTAGYSPDDIEEMKIHDGITLHEKRKQAIKQFCSDNNLQYVKPIVLIACKDTNHAKKIRAIIDSDNFENGAYKNKAIEIHSNMTGEESDENIAKLISIENSSNPIEIVLHVYKLKEGWDVNNLFTIIPLNAAKSDILAMQTIGRGLRLPFGAITGNEEIDTLDIVAHDHYRELVEDIKNNPIFKYKNLDDQDQEKTKSINIEPTMNEPQLSLLDMLTSTLAVKTFNDLQNEKTVDDLWMAYYKNYGSQNKKKEKKDNGQLTLFDTQPEGTKPEEANVEEIKKQFKEKLKTYSRVAISVPMISIQSSSTKHYKDFTPKVNIQSFELEKSKIERYDIINNKFLETVDAYALEVDDPVNLLACAVFDRMTDISAEESVDYILGIVNSYLSQMSGSDNEKKAIIRRYATIITEDIINQINKNAQVETKEICSKQKNLLIFKSFTKTVKVDGVVNYKTQIQEKNKIERYLFNGYKKSYYEENSFDSDSERLFSVVLEEDTDVIKWIKPPLNQMGIFWQAGSQYNPDFLVETKDKKYMVEVKASNEVQNPEVVAKAQEAKKWCKYATEIDPDNKPWVYCLIKDNNIKTGNTCKFILGLSEPVEEV